MPAQRPLEQAFWSKVDKRGSDECWPWTGYHNHRGYARFSRRDKGGPSKGHPAGSMAWVLTYGKRRSPPADLPAIAATIRAA
jgi:hypothetical protein